MRKVISNATRYIKLYRSLGKRKTRKQFKLMPLEGARLAAEAIKSRLQLEAVLLREGVSTLEIPELEALPHNVPVFCLDRDVFDRNAFTESPQGIMMIARRPAYCLEDCFAKLPALVLVADRLQDPGNLGTIIRSAAAAGAGGVILLPGTVDITNPKTLRATMGAFFKIPVVEAGIAELLVYAAQKEVRLVAACGRTGIAYDQFDWNRPAAVFIGNEGEGVSGEILHVADATVTIPMADEMESLNAAIAMSVIFFEASRQRRS